MVNRIALMVEALRLMRQEVLDEFSEFGLTLKGQVHLIAIPSMPSRLSL